MVISDQTYTLKEFEQFTAQHTEHLYELIDGRLIEKVGGVCHSTKTRRYPVAMFCPISA